MNKIIWIYWHQGWDLAPEIALKCKSSWIQNNPGWEVRVLSRDTLGEYIYLEEEVPGIESKEISLASLSDIIRILLLEKYGGIWADSTLLCRVPLDEWITHFDKHDFIAFDRPAKDRMIASWFLVTREENYIVKKWLAKILEYWNDRDSSKEYFWFHYLFIELYATDPVFKQLWDETPKMSAHAPHYFVPYKEKLFEETNDEKIELISKVQSPVFKLTHKFDWEQETGGTVLEYILNEDLKVSELKILVCWYGSFKGSGTLGDYLSVKALADFLHSKGFDFDYVSYKEYGDIKGCAVQISEADPANYDVLLFTCGPIIKVHKDLVSLFDKFKDVYKIGIGVSLFPKDHFNYYNPFDFVLPRENGSINYEDIALAAPKNEVTKENIFKAAERRVGIVLRKQQSEYGLINCKWEEANGLIMRLAEELTGNRISFFDKIKKILVQQGQIFEIDNHLENSGLDPISIENKYRNCDIILTTRFHGSMVALRNNIPFIAIDQISGGAKVYKLVSRTNYPFVWKINYVSYRKIKKAAKELLKNEHADLISKTRQEAEARAKQTLGQLYAHLLAFMIKK